MSPIISCQNISKAYAGRFLFQDISFSVEEDEKVGLIGPNGSGKSTLLKILAGHTGPDEGSIVKRRDLRVAYLPQYHSFDREKSAQEIVLEGLREDTHLESEQKLSKAQAMLSRLGFSEPDIKVSTLSGGWIKRLALALELVKEPELLLLDEPTNHLDLAGVLFLEDFLRNTQFPYVLVSHDRSFLENLATRVIELSSVYKSGFLSVKGAYSDFVVGKDEYLVTQSHEERALASKVRREVAWLMRGARARQTKSVSRIREAAKLQEDLSEVKERNSQKVAAALDFTSSNRRTKELLVGKKLSKKYGDSTLFKDLDVILTPGLKLGLAGANGSGKTTLLKILAGQIEPDGGTLKRAEGLKVVWFDQMRDALDQTITLKEALSPIGDTVTFRGRPMHVASWAKRFLFRPEQLPMQVSYLSGGEQARIFIARLMLQEADLLILDEPTNDLDIPTLEVLEESLDEFPGAVVLVTHDRFMLDSISTHLLTLDGAGGARYFADYLQWQDVEGKEAKQAAKDNKVLARESRTSNGDANSLGSRDPKDRSHLPLSNNEKKELAGIEAKILAAEEKVAQIKERMLDRAIASNHVKLAELSSEAEKAQADVDKIYARYGELEARSKF